MKTSLKILAVVTVAFGIALPVWAIDKEGADSASPVYVSGKDAEAKQLFNENCGACHTLKLAGTDGVVGPNLDDLLGAAPGANEERVLNAILNGVRGAMPAGIVRPDTAKELADWVNRATAKGQPVPGSEESGE